MSAQPSDDAQEAVEAVKEAKREKQPSLSPGKMPPKVETLDVEHLPVLDDPRQWSRLKKNFVLFVISSAAFVATMAASIYFPATPEVQRDLQASNAQIALTASLFILAQGLLPTFWASASEIFGRKKCYFASSIIFIGASIGCALAPSIQSLIGLRVLESVGASAVISVGAGSLADMYDTHERGRKMGIFYSAPLFAQSFSPLIGGALTKASNWRSAFWFCVAYGGVMLLLQIPLPEPYRQERSLAWRKAAKRAEALALQVAAAKKEEKHLASPKIDAAAAYPTPPASPKRQTAPELEDMQKDDLPPVRAGLSKVVSIHEGRLTMDDGTQVVVKVSWRDINPLATLGAVVSRWNNVFLSLFTGLFFGVSYCLTYSGGFTFAQPPYSYSPLIVGCVLLSFGVGTVIGSVLGGRHSDYVYAKLKEANGGIGEPEMRIRSTWIPLIFLPPFLIGYAWAIDKGAPIALVAVLFAFVGGTGMWAYASLLAYIVDANPGRASSAIAFNSACRGTSAFIASQIVQPLLSSEGNGWFYTGFALVLALGELSLLAVQYRGKQWREGTAQQGRKITDARADVPSADAGEPPRLETTK